MSNVIKCMFILCNKQCKSNFLLCFFSDQDTSPITGNLRDYKSQPLFEISTSSTFPIFVHLIKHWFNLIFQMLTTSRVERTAQPSRYSGGSNTEQVWNSDGPQLFGSGPNHQKTELFVSLGHFIYLHCLSLCIKRPRLKQTF